MNVAGHDIGVCSWSLGPKDAADLMRMVRELKLSHVQLALSPLVALDAAGRKAWIDALLAAEISITAGMIGFPGEDYSTIAHPPDRRIHAR